MAPIGPFARMLAQIVVPVIAVLARAIPAAYGQALNNARKAGMDTAASEAGAAAKNVPIFGKRISHSEALQVLNITEEQLSSDPTIVQKQYERYFEVNAVKKGSGSFYLQSKIHRANELLEEYIKEKQRDEINKNNDKTTTK